MAVEGQKTEQVRAYLEYFRDMGIYEFYTNQDLSGLDLISVASTPQAAASSVAPPQLAPEGPPLTHLPARPTPLQQNLAPAPAIAPAPPALQLDSTEPDIPKPISLSDHFPAPSAVIAPAARAAALEAIRTDIGDCTRCPLAYAGRRNIVFGQGDPAARLMFVGEGPGADEDEAGQPFIGKSGQLLNNMIAAMGLSREQVYIANIVKCRPPANRAPEPEEANTCTQFIARQIDVIQPEVIVALGMTAAAYLLGVKQSLASLRGTWHQVRGAKTIVTYHPAYLLRDPRQKGEAWKDLQLVMAHLGLTGPKRS